jgi:hypothetical protein
MERRFPIRSKRHTPKAAVNEAACLKRKPYKLHFQSEIVPLSKLKQNEVINRPVILNFPVRA